MTTSTASKSGRPRVAVDSSVTLSADQFCDRYAGRVYQFARMVARSEAEADDLAQAAIERVLRRLPQYNSERGDVSPWLWRIVVNVAADAGRSAKRRHLLTQRLAGLREHRETVDLAVSQGIEDDRLLAAVRSLTPLQRSIVALRYGVDLQYDAVGQTLGISSSAATRCGNRALAALRARLQEGQT
jgi:RNA polymerase sigma-70 factor (ECF subfamily)